MILAIPIRKFYCPMHFPKISCFLPIFQVLEADLAPFASGISREAFEMVSL